MSAKVIYMSDRLKAIEGKCSKVGDHFILQHTKGRPVKVNSRGYHIVHVSLPGYRTVKMVLARAVFMLRYDRMDLFPGVSINLHVSHLCHQPLCIEESHLVLEPKFVNNNRIQCRHFGRCNGHPGHPNCLLP